MAFKLQRPRAPNSQKILRDISLADGANEWYGRLDITNIRYQSGTQVSISSYIAVSLKSPAPIKKTGINVTTSPWTEFEATVTNEQIDSSLYSSLVEIKFEKAYKFNAADVIQIGIDGDLTQKTEYFIDSVVLGADEIPDISGTAAVQVAQAPDPALSGAKQIVSFTMGKIWLPYDLDLGTTTPVKLQEGTWEVTVEELVNADETTVAPPILSVSKITIERGASVPISVTYGKPKKYSAIDITIGNINELKKEKFHVTVVQKSRVLGLADFWATYGETTHLRRLPVVGSIVVNVASITLNNTQYRFKPRVIEELSDKLFKINIGLPDVTKIPIDTTGYVDLPIYVNTKNNLEKVPLPVRITSQNALYTHTAKAATGTYKFPEKVAPGEYTVQVAGFIFDGAVFMVNTDSPLTVAANGTTTLTVSIIQGPFINVSGFPSFLSFGACVDLTPGNQDDIVRARLSSIFKYAGVSGSGDPDKYLADDTSTRRTIKLARDAEAELNDGNPVLPIMICYTCNLSGGDTETRLQDETALMYSFGNYILCLSICKEAMDSKHPVPAGIIVNPDFISACQQINLPPNYEMPVREPLQKAMLYRKVEFELPAEVTNDIKGYIYAVNWITRKMCQTITFGWQVNLWGVGRSEWVYSSDLKEVESMAIETFNYVDSLRAHYGVYSPNFLAIDRYEADDLTYRGWGNGYCYGPREWVNYFNFCRKVAELLKKPVIPWQIPASRPPLTMEPVSSDFDKDHRGTGGSYILGDAGVGSDYNNINRRALDLEFSTAFPEMGTTFEDAWTRAMPFDLTEPAYMDFPLRGIPAILLGGGMTQGVVSTIGNPESWVRDKLHEYMKDPVVFNRDPSKVYEDEDEDEDLAQKCRKYQQRNYGRIPRVVWK